MYAHPFISCGYNSQEKLTVVRSKFPKKLEKLRRIVTNMLSHNFILRNRSNSNFKIFSSYKSFKKNGQGIAQSTIIYRRLKLPYTLKEV